MGTEEAEQVEVEAPEDGEPTGDDGKRSLFTQFRPEFFVEHPSWCSLEQILRAKRGGSYGLAGPRGAGKTWMMEKALREAEEENGVGVWFPSPSEYEPTAFLAALSDVVATRYEAYYDRLTGRLSRAALLRYFLFVGGGATLVYLAVILLITGVSEHLWRGDVPPWLNPLSVVLVLLAVLGGFLIVNGFIGFVRDRQGRGRVRREAQDLRRQVRYTVSTTENTELGLKGGYSGIGASLKRAHERQMVERPATLSSLIHNFRDFVEAMADAVDGSVVIAIDELDKMSDASRVAQLFRDIKGIFEIPGAYFLVSLSDEAARALGLGAVRSRNEFNSSFYTVISLPPLSPAECLGLLSLRDPGFDEVCGLAIGVLTGGVSREVTRVAELVRSQAGPTDSVNETVRLAIGEELDAFADRVLEANTVGGNSAIGDGDRVRFFDSLGKARKALVGEAAIADVASAGWELNGESIGWNELFAEEWRRVLLRLAVAWLIAEHPELLEDADATRELQQVVKTAAASAAVGRLRLEAFVAERQLMPVKVT